MSTYQKKLLHDQRDLYKAGGDFFESFKDQRSHTSVWCAEPGAQGPYDWMESRIDQMVTN